MSNKITLTKVTCRLDKDGFGFSVDRVEVEETKAVYRLPLRDSSGLRYVSKQDIGAIKYAQYSPIGANPEVVARSFYIGSCTNGDNQSKKELIDDIGAYAVYRIFGEIKERIWKDCGKMTEMATMPSIGF